MSRKKSFLKYTGLFLVVFLLGFVAFFIKGKSFVWQSDGYRQYYPTLHYLGRYYRGILSGIWNGLFRIPMIDYTIGQGEDIITTFANYGLGDPLTLFSVLVPSRYTEYLYDVLVVLRLYLSGISFLIYCEGMKWKRNESVYGALVYTFCGFAIWSIKDPFFLNALIYLPLILFGIERVIRKNRPLFLSVSVLLCVLSSYYFFYMIVLGALAYFAARSYERYGTAQTRSGLLKAAAKDGLCCLAAGIGGVLTSGVLIVPQIYGYLESSRTEAYATLSDLLFYPLDYYKNMLTKFIMVTESNDAGAVWYVSMATIVFVSLYVLFRKKDRTSVLLRNCVLLCALAVASPFVGYVFNGFGYITNRFMFFSAFLLAVVMVQIWPELFLLEKKEQKKLITIAAIYGGVCLLLSVKDSLLPAVFMIVMLGSTLAALCGIRDVVWRKRVVCILIVLNLVGNINLIYQDFGAGIIDVYMDAGSVREAYTTDRSLNEAKKILAESDGDDLQRIDVMLHNGQNPNQSVVAGYHGISVYYSIINSGYCDYMMPLGNTVDLLYSHRLLGNDGRCILENLSNTVYVASYQKGRVPYGFEPVEGVRNLYKNTNRTSLGYTYDSYVSGVDYDGADVFECQNTLLESAVLEPGSALYEKAADSETISQGTIQGEADSLPFDMTNLRNLAWDNGILNIAGKSGSFRLAFSMKPGREYYLRLTGMEPERAITKDMWANVKIGNRYRSFLVANSGYDFYFGRDDYVINLGSLPEGTTETAEKKLRLRLSGPAKYSLEDVELVEVPVEDVSEKMEKLCEESLENVVLGADDSISGTLSLSKEKLLCLTVPYKKGYELFVDGEKTEIGKINKMYTGAWIGAGDHSILLTYSTPGLATGLLLTIVGILFTVLYACLAERIFKK